MSWSTSELRVRLAPLNRFKPSSKIFYWPFQGGTSFVDLLCFCSVLCLLCFVRVCLYVLCGHLLGKGWPLGSRLWCLLWVCHFPIGILGQVWYLIVSIPDLCTITYFYTSRVYFDNVTLTSQKPWQHNNKCDCSKTNAMNIAINEVKVFSIALAIFYWKKHKLYLFTSCNLIGRYPHATVLFFLPQFRLMKCSFLIHSTTP